MKTKKGESRKLTYLRLGVDRNSRKESQIKIQSVLCEQAGSYEFGKVVKLPFGTLFPSHLTPDSYLDMEIEGVGTKTLLAELSGDYSTIGIDGVAMAVNDVIRSGADPILVSDAVHIARSNPETLHSIISGVQKAAKISGCTLASGETGDVAELLHDRLKGESLPFDLFVSCLGIVKKADIIRGSISPGDRIIGLASSGVHSNGLTLARKVLLQQWGGKYDPEDSPDELGRPIVEELMEPTRIYVNEMRNLREIVKIKAALHVTGDGLSKFRRLLEWNSKIGNPGRGVRLKLSRKPAIFRLIIDTAKASGTRISISEMYKTFNMGYGFAIIVSPKDVPPALDSLNNLCPAEDIGYVTTDGKISVESGFTGKTIFL